MNTAHTHTHDAYSATRAFGQWASFLFPLLVVLGGALGFFREAVIRSIVSIQHPELVYAILLAFFAGVLLSATALMRYIRERRLLGRWMRSSQTERDQLLAHRTAGAYLQPLYAVLHGQRAVVGAARQSVLEQEIAVIQSRLQERLTLPQYLAGALVGLGLVGTFVGLLGTLEDLGKIFGALANTGTTDTDNPADLFTDMVRRLQDPMRGMGTAFVASLYGLLGSLVLGLQILLVGKVEHGLGEQMHALLRQGGEGQADDSAAQVAAHAPQPVGDQQLLVKQMADAIAALQAMQQEQTRQWQTLADALREQQRGSQQESDALRREVLGVTDAANTLAQAVRQNVSADERYRASVPRTTYWQDAWVKVQAYLQRSGTDQSLAQLTEASKAQVQTLADVSTTLASIEQRLKAHLGPQRPEAGA